MAVNNPPVRPTAVKLVRSVSGRLSDAVMSLSSVNPFRAFDPNGVLGDQSNVRESLGMVWQGATFGSSTKKFGSSTKKIGDIVPIANGAPYLWCCNYHMRYLESSGVAGLEVCPVATCTVARWSSAKESTTPANQGLRTLRKESFRAMQDQLSSLMAHPEFSYSTSVVFPHGGSVGHWNKDECEYLLRHGLVQTYLKYNGTTSAIASHSPPKNTGQMWMHSPGSRGTDWVPVKSWKPTTAAKPKPKPEQPPVKKRIRDIEL